MSRPSPWPRATHSLLPHTLFSLAATYPTMTYAMFPINPSNITEGYRKITFSEVANAVCAMAWWIEENLGKPKKADGSKTLVYIGPNDIRYAVLCLGSVVAGYKMLFPSPRYGAGALVKLIETLDAKAMLVPKMPLPVVAEVLEKREMKMLQVPSVEHLLTAKPKPYPFTKTFSDHKHEPLICLHSSGTTGFPKPILWTHDWACAHAQELDLGAPPGHERKGTERYTSGSKALFFFPAFHASGVIGMVLLPLTRGVIPVYPPAWSTPGEAVKGALAAIDVLAKDTDEGDGQEEGKWIVDSVSLPPPYIEYLGAHPDLIDKLSQGAETILWAGGSVSRSAGDAVARKMSVVNALASTEMGVWPSISQSDTNMADGMWEYMTPHPALNLSFSPVSETSEGTTCEAVMVKNDGVKWNGYIQPLFKIYTDVHDKHLGDLFIQHPHHPNLWRHHGRADDLLVFSSDEKFHPAAAELRLAEHPDIAEVMMVGTRRPKAALIIRLESGESMVPEDVWKLVEQVNRDSPVYARVERGMVIVVDKPFERTAKGSVRKGGMLELYAREVEGLYGG